MVIDHAKKNTAMAFLSQSHENDVTDKSSAGMKITTEHGRVAQWIRHLTTNQGIPGSSPGMVESFLKGCF